jgi:hypothetical protein
MTLAKILNYDNKILKVLHNKKLKKQSVRIIQKYYKIYLTIDIVLIIRKV